MTNLGFAKLRGEFYQKLSENCPEEMFAICNPISNYAMKEAANEGENEMDPSNFYPLNASIAHKIFF